jgi:hypothetical protein
MRFVPLQHTLAAPRCPGLPRPVAIPLRRFTRANPRRLQCGPFGIVSPVRFYAASGAKRRRSTSADVRAGSIAGDGHGRARRLKAAADVTSGITFSRRRSINACRRDRGNRLLALTGDPSGSEATSLQSAARGGSCTVAFLRRGVPLPTHARALAAWPTRVVLPSARSAALVGFVLTRLPFTGLIPPAGGAGVSAVPGPRAVGAAAAAPIDFRRGDPPPRPRSK